MIDKLSFFGKLVNGNGYHLQIRRQKAGKPVRRLGWLAGLMLLVVLGLGLSGCQTKATTSATQKGIHVVASLNFYGEAAQKILGHHGSVTTVINSPSVDPESFEPDIATAKKVAQANVVIQNGLGYDSWMQRLVAANGQNKSQVLNLGQMIGQKMGANPHLWSDPQIMTQMTRQLVRRFSRLDPQHAAIFRRHGAAYERQLAALPRLARQIKRHANGQQVAVSEPVFNLALKAMGYRVSDGHFAQAIEEDSDPTPADITRLSAQIRHHRIAFFVENTQNSSKNVTTMVNLAHRYHVPVIKVTETKPVHQSYVAWMTSQYRQVLRVQQEARSQS